VFDFISLRSFSHQVAFLSTAAHDATILYAQQRVPNAEQRRRQQLALSTTTMQELLSLKRHTKRLRAILLPAAPPTPRAPQLLLSR